MTGVGGRPRVLVMAYSPLAGDARVLRQLRLLTPDYEVTTLGYGPAPEGVAAHLRLPDGVSSWVKDRRLLVLRRYQAAFDTAPVTVAARRLLTGHEGGFDVVLANDADTVPLALALSPRGGVHADLHEYHPRQNEELRRWRWFVGPYYEWLVATHVARADSVTTVGPRIAEEYQRQFGIDAGVVINAPHHVPDLEPTPVHQPLRLVHSGNAMRGRLETVLAAMPRIRRAATLDLYLVANDPAYLTELHGRYEGSQRVRIHDPVPPDQLPAVLNQHDVGVYVLPPVSFNHEYALPNKLFDFVQGRLALAVGPSPEMAAVVERHRLGFVAEDHSAEALAATIDALSEEQVAAAKAASHAAAAELSAERQVQTWAEAVGRLAERAADAPRPRQ